MKPEVNLVQHPAFAMAHQMLRENYTVGVIVGNEPPLFVCFFICLFNRISIPRIPTM